MKKLLMLKGLPASGKSTYALELLAKDPAFKRLNRDNLRDMVDGGKWSESREKLIRRSQLALAEIYMSANYNVVVDDTNFSQSAQEMWWQFTEQHNATLQVKFFDTPLEECIKRDLKRPNSVGKDVIVSMYNKYLEPEPEMYTPPAGKPLAILCDIDGTLAHMNGRWPYEWARVGEDYIDPTVQRIINKYKGDHTVIFLSSRDSICRPETEEWLRKHDMPTYALHMRRTGDMRKDFIIKRELFDEYIRDIYQIEFVLDDRRQVVEAWRSMGLKVLQVADGNF